MQKWYAIIFVAILSIIAVSFCLGLINQTNIASSALSLFGTFLGATFAFRLNQYKEQLALQSKRRESLNRALFIIIRQYNATAQLVKDFAKYSNDIEKALNMPAYKPPSYSDLTHNFSDLEFLLESENPNIILELSIEQERFHQTISTINIRNEFYVNEFQHAVERAGINGKSLTKSALTEMLGERIFNGALQATKQSEEMLTKFMESSPAMLIKLNSLAKSLYPNYKFIHFETA